jgi:hypothetical protein
MLSDRVGITRNDWIKFLPNVLNQYNHTQHRTTGLTPLDAAKAENIHKVRDSIINHAKATRVYEDLHVGDSVRVLKKKDKYGAMKEHVSNWTEQKYKIVDISEHLRITYYKLDGHAKLMLRHEIKLAS